MLIQSIIYVPNLYGLLNSEMPPGIIEAANHRDRSYSSGSSESTSSARGPYTTYSRIARLFFPFLHYGDGKSAPQI